MVLFSVSRTIFPFLLISFNTIVYSQSLQTLQIQFKRYYKERNSEETVEGTIYFKSPGKVTVVVNEPIQQWMFFKKNGMDIYYPIERKAFRFITQNPVSLPFFQAFIGVVKKDYGLIDMEYTLASRQTKGDTLFTKWYPPKKASKVIGDFTLTFCSDKLIYAESKKPDGSISSRTFYSNHIKNGNVFFPLQISTVRHIKSDTTFEKIIYSNPKFNIELPQDVIYFIIPADVSIKKIQW